MPETGERKWPGYTGQCNPEIWDENAKPPQPTEKKIGQLTEAQVDEYFREGVVLIEDYFTADELEPIKTDIEEQVNDIAEGLHAAGKLKNKYEGYGLFERLTMVNKEFPGANIILHKYNKMPQSFRNLWSGDKLCNAVEQLIGPDIGGHPVWNLRTKTPQDEATTVPWHQDCAYLHNSSYDTHMVGAWIPLLDATPENGCMEFAVRGHRKGKIAMHQCCESDTHYVMLEPDEMRDSLGVDLEKDLKVFPVKYGSMLLFNNCIPHRSLNNLTGIPGKIRWSLDLRFQDFKQNWGFHGLGEGIKFRTKEDPEWRPQAEDWDKFLNTPRTAKYKTVLLNKKTEADTTQRPFSMDTTITGPWMTYWEITNANRHTAGLVKD